jgi:ribonuclease HI
LSRHRVLTSKLQQVQIVDMVIVQFSDGGARGNPGPAATGIAIYKTKLSLEQVVLLKNADTLGEPIKTLSTYLGETTNNVAEWSAVVEGVEWITTEYENEEIVGFLDSELVQRQIIGRYKVKDLKMKQFKSKFDVLMKGKKINFVHVLRENNKLADSLVNTTMDEFTKE